MTDDDTGLLSEGADVMRNHTKELSSTLTYPGEYRTKQWFLLTGPRLQVAAVLLLLVFASLLGLALVNPIGVRDLLTETNAAQTLFSSLLSGAILLVSIVVSINSIVLSQEITDIETQQERITASIEYRRQIEAFIDADITPARPAEFLTTVLYAISRQIEELRRIAEDSSIEEFQEHIDEVATEVGVEIQETRDALGNAQLGSFNVLLAGLNYNYSGQLHAARSLKRNFSDDLSDETHEALDELIDTLQHIATGREYFKSLYYKRELASLSSLLLYVSLPVIVFTSYVILALNANLFPDVQFLTLSPLLISIIFAYTVALAPFLVLTSFVVRTSTITLRTLAAGPFILQSDSEIDALDWEDPTESRNWGHPGRTDDE